MPQRRPSKKHRDAVKAARPYYNSMLRKQGGGCAICGRKPSVRRRLDIDHDHRTMAIRGLLCHRCNRVLAVWITPEWLRLAAAYLEQDAIDLTKENNG